MHNFSHTNIFIFVVLFFLSACIATPTPPETKITLIPGPTLSAAGAPAPIPVISIVADADPNILHPNDTAQIELKFETWLFKRGANTTSLSADRNSPVREMRYCVQFDTACAPSGDWQPFAPTHNTTHPVDWLGERTLYITAQFRAADGKEIPTAQQMERPDQPPVQTLILESVLDTRTPDASQPAFVQTAAAATRTAYPVTGSLEIQNGMCCAGGKLNSTITIIAAFAATTNTGTVTEMRTLPQCPTPEQMQAASWEPFTPQKTYPYTISTGNFVGWYLSVQYRDTRGNLSPIYCDDISIEGMP